MLFRSRLGPVNYSSGDEVFLGRDFSTRRDYSEQTAAEIDSEVKTIMNDCYVAAEYYKKKKDFRAAVMRAYGSLAEENDIIVIEGAGSPAEINLMEDDLVNMGMAAMAGAPVLQILKPSKKLL